eukprot:9035571-Ditylum_brightwellii.AAC.1
MGLIPPPNSVESTAHEVWTSTSACEGSTVPTNSTMDTLCNGPTTPSVVNEENILYKSTCMKSNESIAPLKDAQSSLV